MNAPAATRWRLAAPLAPLLVPGTGIFAAVFPDYSPVVLGVLAACAGLLEVWAVALVVSPGWRQPSLRAAYAAAVIAAFAAFGVVLAWRSLGGGADLLSRFAALFLAAVFAGVLLRGRLPALPGSRVAGVAGGSAVTLGVVGFVLVRLAPVWFAQHLLLPAMLLVVLIAGAGIRGGGFR